MSRPEATPDPAASALGPGPAAAPGPGSAAAPGLLRGLSGKLLVLTVLFVMLGEVLIYVPSIANFRITWLKDRLAAAHITVLVLEAARDRMVSEELKSELLRNAGARAVSLKRGQSRHLMLQSEGELVIGAQFELDDAPGIGAVLDALETLVAGGGRLILVTGMAPYRADAMTEVVLDEAPLRAAMIRYSINILTLSIVLSIAVAVMVFAALNWVLVRPMRALGRNMQRFSENPEDAGRIIVPSGRSDEIGIAEEELRQMQSELAHVLQEKSRLAALGLAVSKVSHDLRNMLANAQLLSDRLSKVDDPTVKRFAPKLIAALDRAIALCVQTLKYGRAQEAPPRRERLALGGLIDEVFETVAAEASSRIVFYNDVAADLAIDADREHLFRIVMNLARNAVEALGPGIAGPEAPGHEGMVRVRAWREGAAATIEVRDNGPGVPEKARAHLFQAFQGAARPGGIGLGLAIAAELVRAHGGEIRLAESESGAAFRVVIPDRVSEVRPGRRGERPASLAGG